MMIPSVLKGSHRDKSENPFDGDTLQETGIMRFYFLKTEFRDA